MARLRLDDALHGVELGIWFGVVEKIKRDACASRGRRLGNGGCDCIGTQAVGGPGGCIGLARAAGNDFYLARNHEC